jgi:hypothetical protein
MFDNLRDQANTNEQNDDAIGIKDSPESYVAPSPGVSRGRFLGMTAPQRLVIAVLMLISVCVLSAMCLLITGRISPF